MGTASQGRSARRAGARAGVPGPTQRAVRLPAQWGAHVGKCVLETPRWLFGATVPVAGLAALALSLGVWACLGAGVTEGRRMATSQVGAGGSAWT